MIPCAQLASLELGYQALFHLTSFLCASLPLKNYIIFLQYLTGRGRKTWSLFCFKISVGKKGCRTITCSRSRSKYYKNFSNFYMDATLSPHKRCSTKCSSKQKHSNCPLDIIFLNINTRYNELPIIIILLSLGSLHVALLTQP